MPDFAAVMAGIQSVGLPVVLLLIAYYLLNKEREMHKTELAEITKAVENNTTALAEVKFMLTYIKEQRERTDRFNHEY